MREVCLTKCGCEFEGECMFVLPVPGDLTPICVALFQSRAAQGLWPWGSAKGVCLPESKLLMCAWARISSSQNCRPPFSCKRRQLAVLQQWLSGKALPFPCLPGQLRHPLCRPGHLRGWTARTLLPAPD